MKGGVYRMLTLVLVQALEKYGFGTRTNEQETTEYEVVDIQLYQ